MSFRDSSLQSRGIATDLLIPMTWSSLFLKSAKQAVSTTSQIFVQWGAVPKYYIAALGHFIRV